MGSRRSPSIAGWLLDEIAMTSRMTWSLFGRVDHVRGSTHNGAGTDLRIRITDVLSFNVGLSASSRRSSYAEAFWNDSTVVRSPLPNAERHVRGEAGVRADLGEHGSVAATYGFRRIHNPIMFAASSSTGLRPKMLLYQGEELTTHSLELALTMRFGFLMIEGSAAYVRQTDASGAVLHEIPQACARGGIYFRDRLLDGALELQAGVRASMRSSFNGSTLLGETLFPLPNANVTIGLASSVDLVLIAHLGDAYIHFLWENLPSTEYFTTPFTPALDRSIRFGVSWEFLN